MSIRVVSRPAEERAVSEFLATAQRGGPSALVLEGEAGIGKTTLWSAAVDDARNRGFRVLWARSSEPESMLGYASLAELLADVDPGEWAELPLPQRQAIDQTLLRAAPGDDVTDARAVAVGFRSIVERLAAQTPVLIAVDDLHWLDPSSAHVVMFSVRRLRGPVGLLGTVRPDAAAAALMAWPQLPDSDAVHRVRLAPFTIGALHAVVSERLGRPVPRQTMLQIHQISGGNPFYAIELARQVSERAPGAQLSLPSALSELVVGSIGTLEPRAHEALLAAACMATPTVEQVAAATGTTSDELTELLVAAEAQGVVCFEGHHLRFTHPLLAKGVHDSASPMRRRQMHRRLAELVDHPELRARHLALASTSGDPTTLQALDYAAESAHRRGAPAVAAELLDLALNLGGDTPARRMAAAACQFDSGDTARARSLLEETIDELSTGPLQARALSQLAHVLLHDNGFAETAQLLQLALDQVQDDVELRAQVLMSLGYAQFNVGHIDVAMQNFDGAVTLATRLGQPRLLGQALGTRAIVRFLRGEGVDESSLRLALQLDDDRTGAPVVFRPRLQHALLLGWIGQVDEAYDELMSIRRGCTERGEDGETAFLAYHLVLLALRRGDLAGAALVADDTMELALQLGGDLSMFTGLTVRGAVATYAGRERDARRDLNAALAAGQRSGSYLLTQQTITMLGFLEVSVGDYEAALTALKPLITALDSTPRSTEIVTAAFVPDAVEALIHLDRIDEAEPLVGAIEANGRRLDRPWMLAIGARCRGLMLAARGDVEAARLAVERAMLHHDRLPMPFERARTQLALGDLQRRQRQWNAAAQSLQEACDAFESLQSPLWAARAAASLARTPVGRGRLTLLTPSEQQVAALANEGMTNRDIGTAMFISPKTVEVNLTRIYRKLGVRSRAELIRFMGSTS